MCIRDSPHSSSSSLSSSSDPRVQPHAPPSFLRHRRNVRPAVLPLLLLPLRLSHSLTPSHSESSLSSAPAFSLSSPHPLALPRSRARAGRARPAASSGYAERVGVKRGSRPLLLRTGSDVGH
eukprot:1537129-Rhodomonas_salina.1